MTKRSNLILKEYLILVILLFGGFLFSQENKITTGIIKDSNTKETLPYATILISNNKGTVSNKNGEFSIYSQIDSISVSYVGYQTKKVKLSTNYNIIFLEKSILNISEVTINSYSEKDLANFIYQTIKNRKKGKARFNSESKSFIKIYSTSENNPVEYSEGFYRLEQDYQGISRIKLKNGKYYFSKNDKNYFSINLISQLIPNLNFFNLKNSIIGLLSPLNVKSKKDILKFYKLKSLGQVNNILTIQFQSKINNSDKGEIYLDITTNNLVKLKTKKSLKYDNIFISLKKGSEIKNPQIALEAKYNKEYQLSLLSINIDYEYHTNNNINNISTHIVTRAYDFNKPFVKVYNLPITQNDYERMKFVKENTHFWNTTNLIYKTKKESQFVEQMEYKKGFQTAIIDDSFTINKNLILTEIPKNQIKHIRIGDGDIITRTKHNPYFHLEIKLVTNIELLDSQIICDVYPVINYSDSYSLLVDKEKQDFVTDSLLEISLTYSANLKNKILISLSKNKINKELIQELITDFQNSFLSLTEKLLANQLSKEDTFENNSILKKEYANCLLNGEEPIIDYIFYQSRIVYLIKKDEKTLLKINNDNIDYILPLPNVNQLKKDVLGNLYILNKDSFCQFNFTNKLSFNPENESLSQTANKLSYSVITHKSKIFQIGKKIITFHNKRTIFAKINLYNNQEISLLYKYIDYSQLQLAKDSYDNALKKYKEITPLHKNIVIKNEKTCGLWDRKLESLNVTDNVLKQLILNYSKLSKPIYTPLVDFKNKFCILNYSNDSIYHFNYNDSLYKKTTFPFSKTKNIQDQLLFDNIRNEVYVIVKNNGYITLNLLDIDNGQILQKTTIEKRFPKKIKVNNGFVYYIIENSKFGEHNKLFRMPLY